MLYGPHETPVDRALQGRHTVLKFGTGYRVVGRFYSKRRQNVVYDLQPLEGHSTRIEPKVGRALLQPMPKPDEVPWEKGPIDPERAE